MKYKKIFFGILVGILLTISFIIGCGRYSQRTATINKLVKKEQVDETRLYEHSCDKCGRITLYPFPDVSIGDWRDGTYYCKECAAEIVRRKASKCK